jgi:outer membrane biosynthesis protein TonB
MSPGWRISPALLAAIAAAAVSFGVCFAVVADATRTVSPDRVAARPARQAVKATLALTPAPGLRVRAGVLPAPAPPRAVTAASEEPATPATDAPPADQTEAPQTTTTAPAEPTPTATPNPKAKPKPKPKAKPKPSGPDFDESGPQGPPSGGSG